MVIFNSYVSLPEGIYFLSPIHLPHRPRAVSAINSAASRGARRRRLEDTMDTAGVMGAESSPISHLASQACWDWKIHGEDDQWEFQDPKMEVPIPYIRPIFQGYVRGYPPKIWPYMVQYLHFRILEFPLRWWNMAGEDLRYEMKSWHDHRWCIREDSWGSNNQKSGIGTSNGPKLETMVSWVKCERVSTANFPFIRVSGWWDDGMMGSCSDDDGAKMLREILPNQNEIPGGLMGCRWKRVTK